MINEKSFITRRKWWFLFIGIFLVAVLIGVTLIEKRTDLASRSGQVTEVKLEVEAPFSTATLTVQGTGLVTHSAQQSNQDEVVDAGSFTKDQMDELVELVKDISFFTMKDHLMDLDDPQYKTDGSTYTITVTRILGPTELGNPTHSVSCYEFNCDPDFLELKDTIIRFWGKNVLEIGV